MSPQTWQTRCSADTTFPFFWQSGMLRFPGGRVALMSLMPAGTAARDPGSRDLTTQIKSTNQEFAPQVLQLLDLLLTAHHIDGPDPLVFAVLDQLHNIAQEQT
jgi:hypothetical protein